MGFDITHLVNLAMILLRSPLQLDLHSDVHFVHVGGELAILFWLQPPTLLGMRDKLLMFMRSMCHYK